MGSGEKGGVVGGERSGVAMIGGVAGKADQKINRNAGLGQGISLNQAEQLRRGSFSTHSG